MTTRHSALLIALVLLVAAAVPAAAATAPVSEADVGDLTVTGAPASTTADAAAEAGTTTDPADGILASSDVAVFRLNASDVPAETDDDGTLLGDEVTLELSQTISSVGENESAKTLDANADTEGVAVNATEDAVYVAVDLESATFEQGNDTATADAGDSFDAVATVTDEATDGENYTRRTSFGVVEPSVRLTDDVSELTAGEVHDVEVATSLAPGTSLTFELIPGDDPESGSGTNVQTTVDQNSRATAQFSMFTYDADEEYTIAVAADGADLNATWSGETSAQETSTAESTDESTETGTEAPGFGVVAALLAIVGAGALTRRE
ncbi:MAG: PGF-CTERM sorting domain-containing protein [Halolamina sp.]